jgi:hypothetical protein
MSHGEAPASAPDSRVCSSSVFPVLPILPFLPFLPLPPILPVLPFQPLTTFL